MATVWPIYTRMNASCSIPDIYQLHTLRLYQSNREIFKKSSSRFRNTALHVNERGISRQVPTICPASVKRNRQTNPKDDFPSNPVGPKLEGVPGGGCCRLARLRRECHERLICNLSWEGLQSARSDREDDKQLRFLSRRVCREESGGGCAERQWRWQKKSILRHSITTTTPFQPAISLPHCYAACLYPCEAPRLGFHAHNVFSQKSPKQPLRTPP